MLHLRHGPFELDLAPEAGGSVAGFRADDRNLLYNDDHPAALDPLSLCAFPLMPFCGRIAGGRFDFAGRVVQLTANLPPEPHAIHGQAWRGVWQVEWSTHGSAALTFEHPAADWPWSYEARQTFSLDRRGLSLDLELTNTDAADMPAGLGWHPYFPKHGAVLQADVGRIWRSGATMIPQQPTVLDPACDLRPGRPVDALRLDDTFSLASRGARLTWRDRTVTIDSGAPLDFLVVYTPQGRDSFCVEPISHVPDAMNSTLPATETGMQVLAPGQTLSARISLTVALSGVT